MHSSHASSGHRAPLRIALVQPDATERAGLKAVLEMDPTLAIVGDAGDFHGAVALAGKVRPAVMIIDTSLPESGGIHTIAELRRCAPATALLMQGERHDIEFIRTVLGAGVCAFVLKQAGHAELLQGIRAAAAGRRFLCESLMSALLEQYAEVILEAQDRSPERLITDREREILRRVALGQSNKHAARELGLSDKTVEKHRSNLMRKLKLHNTAALTMFAIRHGMVEKDLPPVS